MSGFDVNNQKKVSGTQQKEFEDINLSNTLLTQRGPSGSGVTVTQAKKVGLSEITNNVTEKDQDGLMDGEINDNNVRNSGNVLKNLTGNQMLDLVGRGEMPVQPKTEIEVVTDSIRKLDSTTSRKRLDKLENMREGLTVKQQGVLDQEISQLKTDKLGKVDPDNLKPFVDKFIGLTDPGLTISKSKILPLHDALKNLAKANPEDKIEALNRVMEEIQTYKDVRGDNSSKMQWINELKNQLEVLRPGFEIDNFAEFNRSYANHNTIDAIQELDKIKIRVKVEISKSQSEGKDTTVLTGLLNEINTKRSEIAEVIGPNDILKQIDLFHSLISTVNFDNPENSDKFEMANIAFNYKDDIINKHTRLGNSLVEDNVSQVRDLVKLYAPHLEYEEEKVEEIVQAVFDPISNLVSLKGMGKIGFG